MKRFLEGFHEMTEAVGDLHTEVDCCLVVGSYLLSGLTDHISFFFFFDK